MKFKNKREKVVSVIIICFAVCTFAVPLQRQQSNPHPCLECGWPLHSCCVITWPSEALSSCLAPSPGPTSCSFTQPSQWEAKDRRRTDYTLHSEIPVLPVGGDVWVSSPMMAEIWRFQSNPNWPDWLVQMPQSSGDPEIASVTSFTS